MSDSGIPWSAACQASLSFTISWSLLKLVSIESVMPSNHLILCHPLLFLPPIFPSIRVFSNEWPKHWSFSIIPCNEYSVLAWFPLGLTSLVSVPSKRLSSVFSSTPIWKHQFFSTQTSLWSKSHICTRLLKKPKLWLYASLSAKWCLCFLVCCLGLS